MDIGKYFDAKSVNIQSLIYTAEPFFYIPSYQRHFRWRTQKLQKLFNDICHGYTSLDEEENNVTFIGSMILIQGNKLYKHSQNQKKDTLPTNLYAIIDGQQRLTSMLILLTVLHERLVIISSRYQFSSHESDVFLQKEIKAILELLSKVFSYKLNGPDELADESWYPRLTRASQDEWDQNNPVYKTAIASHLYKYGKTARTSYKLFSNGLQNEPDKSETELHNLWANLKKLRKSNNYKTFYDPKDCAGKDKNFLNAVNKFREFLTDFCTLAKGGCLGVVEKDLPEVPSDKRLAGHWNNYLKLTLRENPESFQDVFRGKDTNRQLVGEDLENFKILTHLTLLIRFILSHVGVTRITSENEDSAFDVFESLNTTGEPLTAIETFKPKVVQLNDPVSQGYIETVDEDLTIEQTTRLRNTQDLLITFASEEIGKKISSGLNYQRTYLKIFDKFNTEKDKALFVKNLFTSYCFIRDVWRPQVRAGADPLDKSIPLRNLDGETVFCLDFLCNLKHTIVQPVLIRYYSEALLNKKKRSDFEAIVKACSAYSLLRRASSDSTDNIDQDYRRLLNGNGGKTKPICRLDENLNENVLPSVAEVKQYLRDFLTERGIETRDKWIKKVLDVPHYETCRDVALCLLIAAFDLDHFEPSKPLEMRALKKAQGFINENTWKNDLVETLEHIVPQDEKRTNWSDPKYAPFYIDENKKNPLMHGVGNLVLCPATVNKSFGNKEWSIKRKAYEICAEPSQIQAENLKNKYGSDFSKISLEKYKTTFAPTLRHLAYLDEKDLNDVFIKARGIQIAELAWNRIAPWLDLQPEKLTPLDDLLKRLTPTI